MRILLVNDYREAGGCERIMQRTAVGLRRRGHVVEVFTGEDVGVRRKAWTYIENRRARRLLRARLDRFMPDIVHVFNMYHELSPGVLEQAHRWRSGRDTRIVMTCADAHLVCPNAALQRFRGRRVESASEHVPLTGKEIWLWRWDERSRAHSLLKSASHAWSYRVRRRWRCVDVAIVASRFLEQLLRTTGVPLVRIPDPLPEQVPPKHESVPGGPLRLIFCGRVEPEKGLSSFVENIAQIEGWTLEVVGTGRDLNRLVQIAERTGLGDRITFHGWLGAEQAIERIARADVLVLPSICCENAPASMFEALSCGTGLLVGNRGGMPEIVRDSGVGRIYDPSDAQDVQNALWQTIEDHRVGKLNKRPDCEYLKRRHLGIYLDQLEMVYHGGCGGVPCAC